ncbi:hypothetical protein SLA2020_080340 [Shorea laevis]
MVAIFEHRKIETNDIGNKLKFPGKIDDILTNLSPDDRRNLSRGNSSKLDVKDDQGNTHELTVEKRNGYICFSTNDWNKFIKKKGIKKDDKISLYKEDDGNSGSGAQYSIKVEKAIYP